MYTLKRSLLLAPLIAAAALCYLAAFALRFEMSLPPTVTPLVLAGLWVFVPLKGLSYWMFRLHTSRWRLIGLFDIPRLGMANLVGSLTCCVAIVALGGAAFPRSVYIIDFVLCLLLTTAVQASVRMYREVFVSHPSERNPSRSILIYGAGTAGLMLGKEIRSNPKLATRIVGYLDDDEGKRGGSLLGIPILGCGRDAARVVTRFLRTRKPISEIVIAMPSASASEMRSAIAHCREAGVLFRTLPGLTELLNGKISTQIREVSANDLLGRQPVRIDESRISEAIAGETVLVTGGCGSIGSELCRQVARFNPRKLVILDQAESEMFMLALELRRRFPGLNLATEIGDVFRPGRVREVFARHHVATVFHAAAYKHVPLMEENITEAIENNILGTYNVARAAHWHGVRNFILISSDKAVNPTSIMGVTKRIAELIVGATPLDGGEQNGAFSSVRFGNVLGSAGSVIPIFQRQIAAGGPVTVTHPEMRRYFMSISEAVQLVLQASTMASGSEVFVLDMGEPVRIFDLACNMIRLAGLRPGEDIPIRVTGLRPGEKLFEELRLEGEDILPTPHEKIRRFRSAPPDARQIAAWLERLRILLIEGNNHALKRHLLLLVPEYQGAPAQTESGDREVLPVLATAQAS
jgi:FlaA1/EpsC-like NDP-sugar epimerase